MAKDVIAELETVLSTNLAEFKRDMTAAANAVKDNTDQIKDHLKKTESSFGSINEKIFFFTQNIKLIGGFVIDYGQKLGSVIITQLDYASSLVDTADKLNISTSLLQIYRKVAADTSVSNETLEKSMVILSRGIGELQSGQGSLNSYLEKNNLALRDQLQAAQSTDEAYQIIMHALAEMGPGFEQTALAMAAFGKAGAGMTVMVKDGAAAFDAQIERVKNLGIVIDEKLLRNAEAAGDSVADLSDVLKAQFTSAVIALAPAITTVSGELTKWVSVNRDLIDSKVAEYVDKLEIAISRIDFEKVAVDVKAFATDLQTVAEVIHGLINPLDTLGIALKAVWEEGKAEAERFVNYTKEEISKLGEGVGTKFQDDFQSRIIDPWNNFWGTDAPAQIDKSVEKLQEIQDVDIVLAIDTAEAENKVSDFMKSLEVVPIIEIDADTKKFDENVEHARWRLENGEWQTIDIDADTTKFDEAVAHARVKLEGGEWTTIKLHADTSPAESSVDRYMAEVKAMQVNLRIGGDIDAAQKRLTELKLMVEKEQALVSIGADPTMAKDELRELEAEIKTTESAIKVLADVQQAGQTVDSLKSEIDNTQASMQVLVDTSMAKESLDELKRYAIATFDEIHKKIYEEREGYSTGYSPGQWSEIKRYLHYNAYGQPTNLSEAIAKAKKNPNWEHLSKGTGLSGIKEDGPVFAHKGEIVLNPQESDVFRGIAGGLDPMAFLSGLKPLLLGRQSNQQPTPTRRTSNNYSITVNQQVMGDRPAMTAREMAAELSERINSQKARFGEYN